MNSRKLFLLLIVIILQKTALAQLGETYDIERPEKYAERVLGYEKTYSKKYTLPRKFIQNNISHYNFYFNANEKIKNVLLNAIEAHKDSFDRLLSYYPYSLDYTQTQKQDLDSVIHKATGGILLHDLRTNWVDNFYFLIGKSYFLQKKYDSAEMTFNFINYEFAPKDKEKERILTGTMEEGAEGFSIANKEKRSVFNKLFGKPPSRNESFLWMIRTYVENGDYGSASGLIETLKNDRKFPKRLNGALDDVTAYYYYKQAIYDSAAHYSAKSISIADGKVDKARRNFLTGQLYNLANDYALASKHFDKSIKYSLDPVMEVYARLYSLRLNKSNDPKLVQSNIDALVKMAKKDAYQEYRDIIYYFAGEMELERNAKDAAVTNFLKSAKYSTANLTQKNKTFFKLADIAYADKNYIAAKNYYDSLSISVIPSKDQDSVLYKKDLLGKLANFTDKIYVEDSLQKISKLAANEKDDFLRKLVRRLRKEQGLKDDAASFGGTSILTNPQPTNLFEAGSGEWYFYNNSAKSRGNNEFKQKWGNRPNVDNWRRQKAITGNAPIGGRGNNKAGNTIVDTSASSNKKTPRELTIEALEENLLTSEEQFVASNKIIEESLWGLANLYQFDIEDIPNALATYEQLLQRFPNSIYVQKVYYNLYLAYNKLNDTAKAESYKAKISDTNLLTPTPKKKERNELLQKDATKQYETIYSLFEQEKYADAIALKKVADSLYGSSSWTPQLLYMEASYYAKERKDSLAIANLDIILNQHTDSPMFAKAEALKNVLSRRSIIEHDIEQMKVTRKTDAPPVVVNTATPAAANSTTTVTKPVSVPNTNMPNTGITIKQEPKKDTVVAPKPAVTFPFTWEANKEHYVIIVLNKVENSFINEIKNSLIVYNRSVGRVLFVEQSSISADVKLMVLQRFANAEDAANYATAAQTKAPTEIMPWLAKEKYSFSIITKANLEILVNKKDIENYKLFVGTNLPGKF